ncbi:MAG: 5-formyltetrahydrofolate cyclo-ligase [Lachnospiraceae bacterium]|nr:5-formyltetrahydrofolate cyclo-ligase [Lachnospiraceae bacterium]
MTKKEIREELLSRREKLTPAEREAKDLSIRDRLLADPAWGDAEIVLTYLSCRGETDTRMLIRDAAEAGKAVYAPRITDRQAGEMEFFRLDAGFGTRPGPYGIEEPAGEERLPDDCAGSRTLILLPGVGFSENRDRIGYGGGFYDRYLARRTDLMNRIALCYDCQVTEVVSRVPFAATDIRPDRIITETRTIGTW